MKVFVLTFFLVLTTCGRSFCAENYSVKEAILLGATQGITEYLPVSSTGHLILIDKIIQNRKVFSFQENADEGRKQIIAKNSYFSIIQFGSILAVLFLYWQRFADMLLGIINKNFHGRKLAFNLIISFLPAAVIGVLVDGHLQNILYKPAFVALALAVGACIMLFAEKEYKKNFSKNFDKNFSTLENLTYKQSFIIGCWQCLALIPGMSRSMTTIVGGYRCRLRRPEAAEYSFLLGFVALSAATAYKFMKDFKVIFSCFSLKTFMIGILIAFLSSMLAVKFLVKFISRHGISCFAWYRIILAIVIYCILIF